MQFQIKRCSAPCVNLISQESYKESVLEAKNFLTGDTNVIKKKLVEKMYDASNKKKFEEAAIFRDRIKTLTEITASQNINIPELKNVDLLAIKQLDNKVVIQMTIIRNGHNYGSKSYFPYTGKNSIDVKADEIMQAFICQFFDKNIPAENILVNEYPKERKLVEEILYKKHRCRIKIQLPHRGQKLDLINSVVKNAEESLNRKIYEKSSNKNNLLKLQKTFNFEKQIKKIEVYDNSHHNGKTPIGAMIAFNEDGFMKSIYRRYNITSKYEQKVSLTNSELVNNNDYLMMEEVLNRRLKGKNPSNFPDLLIIDGGKGHLNIALSVLKDLKIDKIEVIAISKGIKRDAGRENFYTKNLKKFTFEKDDTILFFLQKLRDEVHRYAIAGHRIKSKKLIFKNLLDEIDGIGPKRKRALLNEFGSAKSVKTATANHSDGRRVQR